MLGCQPKERGRELRKLQRLNRRERRLRATQASEVVDAHRLEIGFRTAANRTQQARPELIGEVAVRQQVHTGFP